MVGQLRPWGEGTVRISVYRDDGKLHTLSMVNVLHVPELSCNLMSVRQITDSLSNLKMIDVGLNQLVV